MSAFNLDVKPAGDGRALVLWALAWGVVGGAVLGWALCLAFRVRPFLAALEACK